MMTAFLGILLLGWAFGCAHTVVVEVPPRIDLQRYKTIGIVEFASTSNKNYGRIATQKFMGFIQDAQPQVRFLELGPEQQLAKAVGRESLDIEAIRSVGMKYGLSSVFTGRVDITDANPSVSFGADLTSIHATAVVKISMAAKHWDTSDGATIWSGSRQRQWKVAGFHSDSKDISFQVNAPEEQYDRYLEDLAYAITDPFRPHNEKRNAPNGR
jgi:hypothetical protein